MAQDTQFRTDQFNEQARQASESRISRSLEGMGQSIQRFGENYRDQANRDRAAETQQSQFDENMDLQRDQFALTKAQAAQDLWFQQQDDIQAKVKLAAHLQLTEIRKQEGIEKLTQLRALNEAQDYQSQIKDAAELRKLQIAQIKKDQGIGLPSHEGSATGEGPRDVENWKTLSGRPFFNKDQGRWEVFHPKLRKMVGVPKEQAHSDIRILANQRERVRKEAILKEARLLEDQLGHHMEDTMPTAEGEKIIRRLEALHDDYNRGSQGGATGQAQPRRQAPPTVMQKRNSAAATAQAGPIHYKQSAKKLFSNLAGWNPEDRAFLEEIKSGNGREMLIASAKRMEAMARRSEDPSTRAATPEQIWDQALSHALATGGVPGFKGPALSPKAPEVGEHNGYMVRFLYRGHVVPSEANPIHGADMVFDVAEVADMPNYATKRKAGLVISMDDLKHPKRAVMFGQDSPGYRAWQDAVRRAGLKMEYGGWGTKKTNLHLSPEARNLWKNLTPAQKLGDKYILQSPKTEKFFDMIKRFGKPESVRKREEKRASYEAEEHRRKRLSGSKK